MTYLDAKAIGVTEPEEGIIQFEVLPEHVKLLRASKIIYNTGISRDGFHLGETSGFGAAAIDPDKPYGRRNVYDDINDILDCPYEKDVMTGEYPEAAYAYFDRIHQGTALALQIAIACGKFKSATFRSPKFRQDWSEYRPKVPKTRGENSSGRKRCAGRGTATVEAEAARNAGDDAG